jgi:hypothetical protein
MTSVKNIGKPYAGIGVSRAFAKQKLAKLHVRFDEGGQVKVCFLLYPVKLRCATRWNRFSKLPVLEADF